MKNTIKQEYNNTCVIGISPRNLTSRKSRTNSPKNNVNSGKAVLVMKIVIVTKYAL